MRKEERRAPAHEAIAQGQVMLCVIEGCENPAFQISGICDKCQQEIDSLRSMAEQSGTDYTQAAAHAKKRLENFGWAAATITVFLYLLWSLRSWWIEWFEMWFRSGS